MASSTQTAEALSWIEYSGCCDASAGVALDQNWMVIANDEENSLRVYPIDQGGKPAWSRNWNPYVDPDPDHPELDIEGVARVGDQLFWITSHARNKSGKVRESRYRFFGAKWRFQEQDTSTERTVSTPTAPELYPVGAAYSDLMSDLIRADADWGLGIGSASKKSPEEPGAFNIEALTAWPASLIRETPVSLSAPESSAPNPVASVAIALRSPLKNGRAILIPLLNPLEMILESQPASFGSPTLLDLDGRGFRGMELATENPLSSSLFYILAGPPGDEDEPGFRLYKWRFNNQGNFQESDLKSVLFAQGPLHDYNWESVIPLVDESKDVLLMTDEGGRKVEAAGQDCKDLPPEQQTLKSFHALRWTAP